MKFELDMEDYAIILNALHYYKKVEKRGNFKQYNEDRVNQLRDKMAYQLVPSEYCEPKSWVLYLCLDLFCYSR